MTTPFTNSSVLWLNPEKHAFLGRYCFARCVNCWCFDPSSVSLVPNNISLTLSFLPSSQIHLVPVTSFALLLLYFYSSTIMRVSLAIFNWNQVRLEIVPITMTPGQAEPFARTRFAANLRHFRSFVRSSVLSSFCPSSFHVEASHFRCSLLEAFSPFLPSVLICWKVRRWFQGKGGANLYQPSDKLGIKLKARQNLTFRMFRTLSGIFPRAKKSKFGGASGLTPVLFASAVWHFRSRIREDATYRWD